MTEEMNNESVTGVPVTDELNTTITTEGHAFSDLVYRPGESEGLPKAQISTENTRLLASVTYSKERGIVTTLHAFPQPCGLDMDFSCESLIIEEDFEYGMRPIRLRGLNARGVCTGTMSVDGVDVSERAASKVYVGLRDAKESTEILEKVRIISGPPYDC